jgi:tetratricopeptide (TPR) repeat protein
MSTLPLVVSFYAGDPYYYRAAEQLKEDCDRLALDHEIVEAPLGASVTWVQACRYKVKFIEACMRRHDRAILWVDVDCRLLRIPEMLRGSGVDLGFFLRGFRYLKGFDPMALPRLAQPSVLYFGATPAARAYVKTMAHIESGFEGEATDDYFLQEAWLVHGQQLALLLLPPSLVCFDLPARDGECFYFGRSGQAAVFKDDVQQHEIELYAPSRRKAVLLREAAELLRAEKPADAMPFLQRAFEHDRSDEALAHRIARLLRQSGKLDAALLLLRRFQGPDNPVNHARRFRADSALEAGDIDDAGAVTRDLIKRGSSSDIAWAHGRLLRIELEERARARRLKPEQRPAVWWMEGPSPGNVGDILNPYIIEKLSGIPPRRSPRGTGMLAIGSVIKFAKAGCIVWGSGTPRMTDRLDPKAAYRAVRGPLTRQLVLDSGGQCPEVYGDPACFLPCLYQPKTLAKTYKLGLIRHHLNEADVDVADDVKLISVLRAGYAGIERFIDELHECECILSTSLHGLIVAHAYGIPARWCEVSGDAGRVPGDGTKFRDYLLSVGLDPAPPYLLPRHGRVESALAAEALGRLPRKSIDLEALAATAPFKIDAALRNLRRGHQASSSATSSD